jgi:plastocyanin
MDETLFYVCGIALVVTALVVSFIGLRVRSFPAGPLLGATVAVFALLVGATTTFAVRLSQDEAAHREAEQAAEVAEAKQAAEVGGGEEAPASEGEQGGAAATGPGGTLQLAADPVQLAFDTEQLQSKPGEVTIDFTNPAQIEHDVAIEDPSGAEIAKSDLITEGETSVTASLAPGDYTFLCTVPGHAEAGMQGTLIVK